MIRRAAFIVLSGLVSVGMAQAQPRDDAPAIGSLSSEALIARLQDESNQGIGTHATAWASGFMAIDDEPKFNGGIIGSAKPVTSPVMSELVRRGVAALPLLIDHLSDARPTKLTVGTGFTGKWLGNEYDPRDRNQSKPAPGVSARFSDAGGATQRTFARYTVKVGDLCFVAVGQIVDRRLMAVRYQPSLCLVVNSPVETPALAAAVKADWAGLTPADHQRSLEQDALGSSDPLLQPEAAKRLQFYYPEAGNALVLRLLDRPFRAVDSQHPSAQEAAFATQGSLVDALSAFPSQAVDLAVYDLLKRLAKAHPSGDEDKFERCELAYACAKRLSKPEERDALSRSYRKLIGSHFGRDQGSKAAAAFDLRFQQFLQDLLAKLAPRAASPSGRIELSP